MHLFLEHIIEINLEKYIFLYDIDAIEMNLGLKIRIEIFY